MESTAVITLNYNRADDTLAFLESARQQTMPAAHMIVVDNGSSDPSVELIKNKFPEIELLVHSTNLGFARGMNSGIRRALEQGAECIFIANNDTLLAPDMLELLVRQAQQNPSSIIAPVILYASQPDVIWSAGAASNPLNLEIIDTWRGKPAPSLGSAPYPVEFITACGMLVSAACFEKTGLFDERFFMYYEDSDFSFRIRQAGYQILVDPQARMWHKVAASSGGSDSVSERYWMARSSLIYFRKHARSGQWLIIGPYRLGSAIKTSLRLLLSGKTAALRAYWRGLKDGLKA